MSDTLQLDPAKTAVVLIEYQNEFTSEGGALHGAVAPVMERTGMLTNTVAVVDALRSAGATIMHAPITFADGYNELSKHPYGILKGVVDGNAFVKETWGAAIVDELTPVDGDIVIEGKRGLDAFASTNLDFILRRASTRSCSADSSPTAVSSRRCAAATRTATASSRSPTAWPAHPSRSTTTRSSTTTRCSRTLWSPRKSSPRSSRDHPVRE